VTSRWGIETIAVKFTAPDNDPMCAIDKHSMNGIVEEVAIFEKIVARVSR